MKVYKLTTDRFGHKAGTTVYHYGRNTYGLVSDDERATGVPHLAVSLEPDKTPFFTVPENGVEEVKS